MNDHIDPTIAGVLPTMPAPAVMTFEQARAELRALVGDTYISLTLDDHGPGGKVRFGIYANFSRRAVGNSWRAALDAWKVAYGDDSETQRQREIAGLRESIEREQRRIAELEAAGGVQA